MTLHIICNVDDLPAGPLATGNILDDCNIQCSCTTPGSTSRPAKSPTGPTSRPAFRLLNIVRG